MVNTARQTTAKGEAQASAPKTTCKRLPQQQGAKTCRERRRPGTSSKALRHNANVGMRSKLRRYVAPTLSPRARRESSHHTDHGAHSHTQKNCLSPCTRQPFAQRLYWLSTLSSASLFASRQALSRCWSTRSNLPGTSASQAHPTDDGRSCSKKARPVKPREKTKRPWLAACLVAALGSTLTRRPLGARRLPTAKNV